jgi:MFS family permease
MTATMATPTPADKASLIDGPTRRRALIGSAVGSAVEWYDYFLYGTMSALVFGPLFFPSDDAVSSQMLALASFALAFLIRPIGGVIFSHIGDRIGRKRTLVITLTIMGVATVAIGLMPTYAQIGMLAPILLTVLRLLQGLALGGEYGGAATYVAEHVPDQRRGFYTSFIQTTATAGFFISMLVIGTSRTLFGEKDFGDYGWRVPFLLSFILLVVSLYMRVKMNESPLFAKLKREGKTSRNPLIESFANKRNLRYVVIALFGATAGQGVVWYTGQFYALTFLQAGLKLPWQTAYLAVAVALAITTPLFIVFGHLSDRIGRKKIMLLGCALGALTYVPLFMALKYFGNPAGLPVADPANVNLVGLIAVLSIMMVYVCMVYGPIAAFLVELFPTQIRYTSMSLPYHIGNGWFGGFLPLIATAVTTSVWAKETLGPNAIYGGLAYPIFVCVLTVIVGSLYIRETKDHRLDIESRAP